MAPKDDIISDEDVLLLLSWRGDYGALLNPGADIFHFLSTQDLKFAPKECTRLRWLLRENEQYLKGLLATHKLGFSWWQSDICASVYLIPFSIDPTSWPFPIFETFLLSFPGGVNPKLRDYADPDDVF